MYGTQEIALERSTISENVKESLGISGGNGYRVPGC